VPAAIAAALALPPWLNASLRPMRLAKAFGPTMPSVMAAMAGANSEPATAVRAFSTATMVKPPNSGRANEPRVTTTAAVTRIARLA